MSQTIVIPDPFDPTAINAQLADHEARLKKLETPIPIPTPVPTSGIFLGMPWNVPLTATQPISLNSPAMVAELVTEVHIATTINTTPWTMPFYKVHGNNMAKTPVNIIDALNAQPLIKARFAKGIPIPIGAGVGVNSNDRHFCLLDLDTDTYYELDYAFIDLLTGAWKANCGGIIDNFSQSNGIMPAYSTDFRNTATATWLPVIGGLITYDEVNNGLCPHALSMCLIHPSSHFVYPAKASDGDVNVATSIIPEGTRFRLPASFVVDKTQPRLLWVLQQAIRDYGIIVRDRGGACTVYAEDLYYRPDLTATFNPWSNFRGGLTSGQIASMLQFDKWQVVA